MRLVPALAALALVPVLAAAEAPVPVAKVVLYASGVGYVEHLGSVEGDATSVLRFKADQLNDVLKSLLLQDLDQGRVASVEYPSQAPLERTLKSFQVDITGSPSLPQLLAQLRGARISLQVQTERVAGTILGCEQRQRASGDKAVVSVWILTLVTADGVRQVELDQAGGIRFEDPGLQQELERALAALAGARDQDKKPVVVRFRGDGRRRVRIGYVIEAPVWKTSYRLVMPEAGAAQGLIQGWAIVENQTESDWSGVDLSLVSGRPVSFVQDLYRPLYAVRPVVEPPLPPGVRPVAYDSGRRDAAPRAESAERLRPAAAKAMAAMPAPAPMAMAADAAGGAMDIAASVAPVATAADQVGELFQYQVPQVTLPRSRSAMLPIVGEGIEAERVSIFDPEAGARHPLNGAWLRNTTGKHLQGGPATVLDGGAYAGDARLDHLAPGARRLVSYAVDLPVTVDCAPGDEARRVVSGVLAKGVLRLQTRLTATRTYDIASDADRPRTVLVAHRFREGWSLERTPEPAERTATHLRFRVEVKPRGQARLAVTETLVSAEEVAVLDLDGESVQAYAADGALPAKVRDALLKAAGLKAAVAELDRQVQQRQEQVQAIAQEQQRIRENMKTVAQNSPYAQRLLQKLNEQETKVEGLQAESERLRGERDAKRAALAAWLASAAAE